MSANIAIHSSHISSHLQSRPHEPLRAKRRRFTVVVHGLRHFCHKLPGLLGNDQWEVRDRSRHTPLQLAGLVRDLRSCDMVFTWAGRVDMGRFLWAARSLGVEKLVLFWCGSDVLRAQKQVAAGKLDPWIAQRIHWAASPVLADEVRSLGLQCEFVQASFVDSIRDPKPLPKEFTVLVFLPRPDVAELYGWDRVLQVARVLPDIKFKLIGLHPGQSVQTPPNISVHYWTKNPRSLYEDATVLWRPVRHDAGVSFMVLEALSHGRHVLYTYPFPGGIQVKNAEEAKRHLEKLKALHDLDALPLNHAGMESVARIYARDVVQRELHRRWEEIIRS
jgi:hypothetical protein